MFISKENIHEILLYLGDIENYVYSYLYYLNNSNENLDKKEIDMYISCIPEIINTLKEMIIYEKESK